VEEAQYSKHNLEIAALTREIFHVSRAIRYAKDENFETAVGRWQCAVCWRWNEKLCALGAKSGIKNANVLGTIKKWNTECTRCGVERAGNFDSELETIDAHLPALSRRKDDGTTQKKCLIVIITQDKDCMKKFDVKSTDRCTNDWSTGQISSGVRMYAYFMRMGFEVKLIHDSDKPVKLDKPGMKPGMKPEMIERSIYHAGCVRTQIREFLLDGVKDEDMRALYINAHGDRENGVICQPNVNKSGSIDLETKLQVRKVGEKKADWKDYTNPATIKTVYNVDVTKGAVEFSRLREALKGEVDVGYEQKYPECDPKVEFRLIHKGQYDKEILAAASRAIPARKIELDSALHVDPILPEVIPKEFVCMSWDWLSQEFRKMPNNTRTFLMVATCQSGDALGLPYMRQEAHKIEDTDKTTYPNYTHREIPLADEKAKDRRVILLAGCSSDKTLIGRLGDQKHLDREGRGTPMVQEFIRTHWSFENRYKVAPLQDVLDRLREREHWLGNCKDNGSPGNGPPLIKSNFLFGRYFSLREFFLKDESEKKELVDDLAKIGVRKYKIRDWPMPLPRDVKELPASCRSHGKGIVVALNLDVAKRSALGLDGDKKYYGVYYGTCPFPNDKHYVFLHNEEDAEKLKYVELPANSFSRVIDESLKDEEINEIFKNMDAAWPLDGFKLKLALDEYVSNWLGRYPNIAAIKKRLKM